MTERVKRLWHINECLRTVDDTVVTASIVLLYGSRKSLTTQNHLSNCIMHIHVYYVWKFCAASLTSVPCGIENHAKLISRYACTRVIRAIKWTGFGSRRQEDFISLRRYTLAPLAPLAIIVIPESFTNLASLASHTWLIRNTSHVTCISLTSFVSHQALFSRHWLPCAHCSHCAHYAHCAHWADRADRADCEWKGVPVCVSFYQAWYHDSHRMHATMNYVLGLLTT